ncbi:MAG TPA: SGNH/GDSL hydrolase family protein [Candidatus Dormibacteraeota bacterium]|nr:SGNH/GDSL hydrolase family protein [Candidatus Dormibacteraeota bacterium]
MSRALLAMAGVAVALLAVEIGLRLHPLVDLPLNDPYQLTRLVGTRQFRTPFHTYREIYPVQFDHDGYYQRSDGAIDYHFDQDGGRWIEPRARDLRGDVAIVVGDSFTLGFGVRYEDAYVFRTEQALGEQGRGRHFVNFAEPGADARGSLRNYLAVRDQQPHDLVLFGLHLNDLIHFPTSYVAMAGQGANRPIGGSQLLAFAVGTLAKRADRNAKIRELTDPAQRQQPLYRDNMAAIESMSRAAAERGRRFAVVILPILVDLRAGTFEPVYAAIRSALEARGIRYIDLSHSLDGERDASLWILPFDQHPNERAHAAFARSLSEALLAEP